MKKVLVIGSGAFGSALVQALVYNNHLVDVYGICQDELDDLKYNQKNTKYFNDLKLHKSINNTYVNLDECMVKNQYDFIVFAIPSFALEQLLNDLSKYDLKNTVIINAIKGLNPQNNKPWCMCIESKITSKATVSLSGPSFAIDVFMKKPTIVNLLSKDVSSLKNTKQLFDSDWFITKISNDYVCANYVACFKNALAIGCGIVYGLYSSNNSSAAYLTKGIQEMQQIASQLSDIIPKSLDYYFIGDSLMTCTDIKSRNFSFGVLVANIGITQALIQNKSTIEGYNNLKSVKQIIDNLNIKSPLFNELYEIIYNNKDVSNIFKNSLKDE